MVTSSSLWSTVMVSAVEHMTFYRPFIVYCSFDCAISSSFRWAVYASVSQVLRRTYSLLLKTGVLLTKRFTYRFYSARALAVCSSALSNITDRWQSMVALVLWLDGVTTSSRLGRLLLFCRGSCMAVVCRSSRWTEWFMLMRAYAFCTLISATGRIEPSWFGVR